MPDELYQDEPADQHDLKAAQEGRFVDIVAMRRRLEKLKAQYRTR